MEGRVFSRGGKLLATLEYRHSADCYPRLSIRMGEETIEIRSDCKPGSKGDIIINGSRHGRFDCTINHYPMFFDSKGNRILHMESDDYDRRFLWAFRNGFCKKEARQYAAAMHALLVGPDFVLASINTTTAYPASLWDNTVYPLMNEADEQIWASKSTGTRLCILAAACWWLCAGLHHRGNTGNPVSPWDAQVNVPSSLERGGRTILDPEHLPPVDAKVEYLATCPLAASICLACSLLFGLVILPLAQQEFNAGFLAFTFYTSIIPVIWILVCQGLRRNAARKIRAIEQQLNPPDLS